MPDFTQFGIAGAVLVILYFMIRSNEKTVRYFTSAIDKKDEYIKKLVADHEEKNRENQCFINEVTDKYRETVNEYMRSGDESRRMQTNALQEQTRAMQELTIAVNRVCQANQK